MSLPLIGVGKTPAAGGFQPSDIAGLKCWLKADAITGLNDGDAVTTWEDSSDQNNDATQSTASNKPTYKTSIVNGKPVVRFDGANDRMTLPNFLGSLTQGEIFIAIKIDNDPPTDPAGGLWEIGSDSQETLFPWSGDSNVYDSFGTTARKDTGNPTPSLASWNVYNVSTASGNWTSRLNGTQHFTTGTNTVGWTTAPVLGRSGTYFLDGDLAELILYDSVLSSGDRSSVLSYLNTKYGL